MTLQKDINEIIKKNLPEQVAGELKEVLSEYETLKKECEDLKERNQVLQTDLQHYQMNKIKVNDLKESLIVKEKELSAWAEELKTERFNLDNTILQIKLTCAENVNEKYIGFIDALMRNTVYREQVYPKTVLDGRTDASGNYSSHTVVTGTDVDREAE